MQLYLQKDNKVADLINKFPSIEAFENQVQLKKDQNIDREQLVRVLEKQNREISISDLTKQNIKSLLTNETFTVVTGHQPCLFTGPLYFIIKILNAIKLSDDLNNKYKNQDFVPVYWMGAEDHDYEEINHFNLYNKQVKWETNQSGAVGRFNTEELEKTFQSFDEILGDNENAKYLKQIFKKAYLNNHNYSMATRVLVNELFSKYGLVIIDGDDPDLKKSFYEIAKAELEDRIAFKNVSETNRIISKLGKAQVKPREINLFYLHKNSRRRIIYNEGNFVFDGESKQYNQSEVLSMLKDNPEKFSPNVLLRPLYQEKILPNLAYIGGSGEIAYWLQLKSLFQSQNIVFPLLVVRNSFLFVNQNQAKKFDKLKLTIKDVFLDEQELIKKVVSNQDEEVSFEKENKEIEIQLDILSQKAEVIDPTLKQAFLGEKKRILKSIDNLEKRAFKALKNNSKQNIELALNLKAQLLPGGGLQERNVNFSSFYEKEGEAFFDSIYENIDSLDASLNILIE